MAWSKRKSRYKNGKSWYNDKLGLLVEVYKIYLENELDKENWMFIVKKEEIEEFSNRTYWVLAHGKYTKSKTEAMKEAMTYMRKNK
jgi:hypothetical protein